MAERVGNCSPQFSEIEGGSIELGIFEKRDIRVRVECDSDSLKIYDHPGIEMDIEFERKNFQLGHNWDDFE